MASFADLGQSHLKTLRLTPLSRLGRPCQLGPFNQQQPVRQLGHELELPNVVFTDFTKYDIDQPKYLFQKWSHFNSSNSLTNCYLSSKYGIDDFSQFWIDNFHKSTDPFIQNLLFLTHQADQCLTDIDLREQRLTNAELMSDQQLLENEAILALDAQIANETSAQMVRQNSDWLDASIERANAQLAEANFQVLEDRLDTSVELEISNHLQQMDWTDWELSNQISHLHKNCITSKRGGFLLTSGTPDGSGGSSGNGGSGGRGFGGSSSGGQPPSFGPDPNPAFSLSRLLFYCSVGIICYFAYQWAKGKIREELANLLLECQQAQKEQEQASPTPQGQRLAAVRPKNLFLKKIILFTGGACFDPSIFISALRLFTPVWLSRAFWALAPSRLLRTLLGALFSLGVQVISPIVQTLTFGALLYFMNVAIGWFVPLAPPILGLMQGFFLCPTGGTIAMICVEKQVKILACTFWFGSLSVRFASVYRENKLILVSLAVFAVGIFILMDQTFCHQAARQIMGQPFARLLDNQLGQ